MGIAKHTEPIAQTPVIPSWELTPRGDGYLQIRINRRIVVAFMLSLLLHMLLLITLAPKLLDTKPITAEHQSLVVRLAPPNQAQAKTSPAPAPLVRQPLHKPKAMASPATPTPSTARKDWVTPTNLQPTHSTTPNSTSAPTDMLAYVNANRARREASENLAARENAIADDKEREPTEDEQRTATIKRNLQQGTNGLFQIISLSARTAQFSFRGWTNDLSYSKREIIDVDAPPDVDIRRAVVRKMIELIRRYHSGDFNWESPRLNRVVVLSARAEDSAGLEDFLLQEFFGPAAGIPTR